ncbi:MAG: hypothetical protein ACRD45_07265 [Bryobacteraceae bacterium]
MTILAASPCRNAHRFRQPWTGHDDSRPDTQLKPQRDQTASFKVSRLDRTKPLIQRNDLKPCAASPHYLADASSAALKSP